MMGWFSFFSGLDLFWEPFFFQGKMAGFQPELSAALSLPAVLKLFQVPVFWAAGMTFRVSAFYGFQWRLMQPDLKVF